MYSHHHPHLCCHHHPSPLLPLTLTPHLCCHHHPSPSLPLSPTPLTFTATITPHVCCHHHPSPLTFTVTITPHVRCQPYFLLLESWTKLPSHLDGRCGSHRKARATLWTTTLEQQRLKTLGKWGELCSACVCCASIPHVPFERGLLYEHEFKSFPVAVSCYNRTV